jgi:hypothetical protein
VAVMSPNRYWYEGIEAISQYGANVFPVSSGVSEVINTLEQIYSRQLKNFVLIPAGPILTFKEAYITQKPL